MVTSHSPTVECLKNHRIGETSHQSPHSMSRKKTIEGVCSICGKTGKLTYEHVPPQAAFNSKPVWEKRAENLFPFFNPHLYGKRSTLNKGAGGYKLCQSCNNNTGANYAPTYISLARAVREGPTRALKDANIFTFRYRLHPLRFIKQVMIMHLCADQVLGQLRDDLNSAELMLHREAADVPVHVKIYMYLTFSGYHRFLGIGTTALAGRTVNVSEVSYSPFGFLLSLSGPIQIESMMDITGFINYGYTEEEEITFILPHLEVPEPLLSLPGRYLSST